MKLLVPEVTGDQYSRTYLLALEAVITETQVSSTSFELSFRGVQHFSRHSHPDDVIHSTKIHFFGDTYIYHIFLRVNFGRAQFHGMHAMRINIENMRNCSTDSSLLIMFLKNSICTKVHSLMVIMIDELLEAKIKTATR